MLKDKFLLSKQLALVSVTGFALACLCAPVWAADGVIRNIQYDPASRHFMIDASGPVRAIVNTLTIAGHKRVIVDIDNAEIGAELPKDSQLLQQLAGQFSGLRNVTVNQYGGSGGRPIVRILLDIESDLQVIRLVRNQGPRLELEVNDSAVARMPASSAFPPNLSGPARVEAPHVVPQGQSSGNHPQPASTAPMKNLQTSVAANDPTLGAYTKPSLVTPPSSAMRGPATSSGNPSVSELQNALQQMNQRNEALRQENQALRTQMGAPRKIEPDEQQLAGLKSEIDRLKTTNANLQGQLNGLLSAGSTNEQTLMDLQKQLTETRQRLSTLTRESVSLKTELSAKAEAEPVSTVQQAELERLKKANQSLQIQLQQAKASNSQPDSVLQTQLAGLKSTNLDLQTKLQESEAAKSRLSPMLTARQAEVDLLKREKQYLQNNLEQVKAGKSQPDADTLAQISRLKADNQDLQNRLQQATSNPAKTIAVDELKQTLVRMNQQYETLKAENERLRTQTPATADVSDADLKAMRNQLTTAQQSLNDAIRTINEQNKEIAYLRNQITDVKAGMDVASREQISRLQADDAQKAERIRLLEQQLAEKATPGHTAAAGSQTEAASLKRQLEQTGVQYKRTIEELTRQIENANAQYKRSLEAANTQITLQNQQLQDRDRQLTELKSKSASLETQLAGAKTAKPQPDADTLAQIARLKTEKLDLETKLAATNGKGSSDITRLMAQQKTQQEEVVRLTTLTRTLQAENDSLKKQAPSPDSEQTSQWQTKIAGLQAELTQLHAQYEQSVREAQKAREDLDVQKKLAVSKPSTQVYSVKPNENLLKKEVDDLTRQLSEARRENVNLKKQRASVSTEGPTAAKSVASNPEAQRSYDEGKSALAAGDLQKALDKMNQAQLLEPDNSRFAIDYSVALSEDGRNADAIDHLRRYLQRNPGDRDAYNQMGKIYLLNDQADAASQAFSRAISVSMLNNYATSLKKLDKMDDAEQVFKLALKLNPSDSEVLFNLGNLYNAQNKLELARNNYLHAIQLKPDFAEAHYNLGLIYSKTGDKMQAVSHLEKFLQLSPNARNAETIRSYVAKLKT